MSKNVFTACKFSKIGKIVNNTIKVAESLIWSDDDQLPNDFIMIFYLVLCFYLPTLQLNTI
jgi:hypothetical protein